MGKTKTAVMDNTKKEKVHLAGLKGGQRVKMVETEIATEVPSNSDEPHSAKASRGLREPKARSKKYHASKAKVAAGKSYSLKEAVILVKDSSYSKFEGTMEMHLVLKKMGTSAQVTLPHQAGKEKRVELASDETVNKLKAGKIDFDILVATADMMPKLVPFAKVLGPKGLMPNPKNGTLVTDPKKAKSFSAGIITVKTEKEAPLIHVVIGKNSQKDEEIIANAQAIIKALDAKQIIRAFLKSTMSPSVRIAL